MLEVLQKHQKLVLVLVCVRFFVYVMHANEVVNLILWRFKLTDDPSDEAFVGLLVRVTLAVLEHVELVYVNELPPLGMVRSFHWICRKYFFQKKNRLIVM